MTVVLEEKISDLGYGPYHVSFQSIRREINNFVKDLEAQKIIINEEDSEKEISYIVNDEERKSLIPFFANEDGLKVTKYFLRGGDNGEKFEISFSDEPNAIYNAHYFCYSKNYAQKGSSLLDAISARVDFMVDNFLEKQNKDYKRRIIN